MSFIRARRTLNTKQFKLEAAMSSRACICLKRQYRSLNVNITHTIPPFCKKYVSPLLGFILTVKHEKMNSLLLYVSTVRTIIIKR